MDPSVATPLAGLLVMQGVNMFSAHAPKIADVRRSAPGSGTAADLRVAELEAVAVMVLCGTAISAMSKTPIPLWLALATSATMVGIYEWVLHQPERLPVLTGEDGPTLVAA
jgi:hypothetical protein